MAVTASAPRSILPRTRWLAAAACALALLQTAACGREDPAPQGPERADFEAVLVERDGLSPVQASCVAADAYEAYGPDELQALLDRGISGITPARWSPFSQALVGCTFGMEPDDG